MRLLAAMRRDLSIGARDHADDGFLSGYRRGLRPGSARLVLGAAPESPPRPAVLALAALLVNAAFAGDAILWSRRPSRGAFSGS